MITPTKPWSRPNCRHAYGLDISKVGVWPNKKYVAMCHICMLRSSPRENATDARGDVWRTTLAAERRETEKIATRCNHEGYVVLMRDWTAWDMCEAELYYGLCYNCKMRGPNARSAYRAGQLFKEKTLRVFQLLENPILETHAKYTVNSTADMPWPWDRIGETPGIRKWASMTTTQLMPIAEAIQKYVLPTLTEQYATAKMLVGFAARPDCQRELAKIGYKFDQQAIADLVNSTNKQIQEALVATAPNPKPYFIVVSSEGHAAIPIQHPTQQVAQTEADRLTKIKPGVTFTVFEAKSSVNTPKVETKKTVYETPNPFAYWLGVDYPASIFGTPYVGGKL